MDSNLKLSLYNKKRIKKKDNYIFIGNNNSKHIEEIIYKNLNRKYNSFPSKYDIFITNHIIFNDKIHIVSKFKEYLIIDDLGEFLKRYYNKNESLIRLSKFFEFYFLYSKVFPNYTPIYENKFLYNNIHLKQKMIDTQEKKEIEKKNKIKNIEIEIEEGKINNKDADEIFNTDIINSLLNDTNKEGIEILFNVNKDKLFEEENNFEKGVNYIINEINDYQNKRKKINDKKDIYIHFNSIYSKNNKKTSNYKIMLKSINLNNKDNSSHNYSNHHYFLPKVLKKEKNKILKNKINEIRKNVILKRNNNMIINLTNKNSIKNNSKKKLINEKNLFEKIEKDLFKLKKNYINEKKNNSQNISTSIQTKKDNSLYKKNNSLFYWNKKKLSASTLNLNIFNNPSFRIISTKISSNSIKNKIKKSFYNKCKLKSSNKVAMSHKNLKTKIVRNKDINIKNKELQTSTTSFNILNIVYNINRKYKDSKTKKNRNINITTSTKIDSINLNTRNKNKKIRKIKCNNFSNKLKEYESNNNRECNIKYNFKKFLLNKKKFIGIGINFDNSITSNKSLLEKISITNRFNSKNKKNSSKNLIINSFKKISSKKPIKKNTTNNLDFCYSTRNLGRNYINKNKYTINCSQSKLNLTNKSKIYSKDNSFKKDIILKLNNMKNKIHNIKKNSFYKVEENISNICI